IPTFISSSSSLHGAALRSGPNPCFFCFTAEDPFYILRRYFLDLFYPFSYLVKFICREYAVNSSGSVKFDGPMDHGDDNTHFLHSRSFEQYPRLLPCPFLFPLQDGKAALISLLPQSDTLHAGRLLESPCYLFCFQDFLWALGQVEEQPVVRHTVQREHVSVFLSFVVVLGRIFPSSIETIPGRLELRSEGLSPSKFLSTLPPSRFRTSSKSTALSLSLNPQRPRRENQGGFSDAYKYWFHFPLFFIVLTEIFQFSAEVFVVYLLLSFPQEGF
ncbi:hypothetical protein Tco_1188333, partial [Tanacetum coccineum]